MNKYASLYLTKLAATLNPDDIITTQSERGPFSGVVSDYFLLPESLRRSGRVSAMQEAVGEDPSLTQRYPITSRILKSMGFALPLSLVGGFIGDQVAMDRGMSRNTGIGIGVGLGALGGALTGGFLDVAQKRDAESEAIKKIKQKSESDTLHTLREGNPLAALMSGVHQLGRSEVAKAISGDPIDKDLKGKQNLITAADLGGRVVGRLTNKLVPGASVISGIPAMAGSVKYYVDSAKNFRDAKR